MDTRIRSLVIYAGMIFIAVILAFCFSERAYAYSVNDIPDEHFRQYVESNFDMDHDGVISQKEAEAVTYINVSGKDINSLKGIEIFTNLETLLCRENKLTSLDMSGNPKLTELVCDSNELTELDLTKNSALTDLSCFDNRLPALDLSGNPNLESLTCGGPYNFSSIDLSHNKELISFAYLVGGMQEIDFSQNTKLQSVWISAAPLKELDLTNNRELVQVLCYNTDIVTISLSDEPGLSGTSVNLNGNRMISLHCYITGGAEINTTGQKPLEITVPAGVTSYDLRDTDPLISPQAITNVTGGEIKDAVVYGIYDGMEIGYTYTENGASLDAHIIFHTEEKVDPDPSDPAGGDSGSGGNWSENDPGSTAVSDAAATGTAGTGDDLPLNVIVFLMIISAAGIVLYVYKQRR